MKKILIDAITGVLLTACIFSSCTGNFENYNTNPFGVSDEELLQDNNYIGMHFPKIQKSIYWNNSGGGWEFQLIQNLNADMWSGYMATPTNFQGGVSNITYNLPSSATWNDNCWNYTYNDVMTGQLQITEKCKEIDYEMYGHFDAINTVLRVFAMSRLADQYGPIIYSKYGETKTGGTYDSAQDVYKIFFQELTEASKTLVEYSAKESATFAKFDMLFKGNLQTWAKLANTLRLRLAIRISKYDATWAKTEGEEAIKAEPGLLTNNTAALTKYEWRHPLYTISDEYTDVFISANIKSIMGGYDDPRLSKYGIEVEEKVIGVRTGMKLDATVVGKYKNLLSKINVAKETPGILITAAESYFLLAEAALRGWSTGGTAKDFYESGIKASFSQWGVSVGEYLNSTKVPESYIDPLNPTFNSPAVSTVSPKWDDATTDEERLEKIITQKWIAGFPEGMNAWAEWRRTGYPKQFPVLNNESQGVISTELGVRRLIYTNNEKSNNAEGYAQAVQLLGGPDTGATRLFWDIDKPNL